MRAPACLLLLLPWATSAELGDVSKLPPPASQQVNFARDIYPILSRDCLRCHGSERPKSGFRLTDRASALKGGENGIDIVPGKSAQSPLIHYVTRIVEDKEMPPEGKGQPLTTNEISLLRAWIDQGVPWDEKAFNIVSTAFELSPFAGWTGVSGDVVKFRELEWQPRGWNGGLEKFSYSQRLAPGETALLEGHVSRDDYKVLLELRKMNLGFTRFGFEQYRKYYVPSGGFAGGFNPPIFDLPEDLHMDIGKAWAEIGLSKPNLPNILVGYEYQYKDGEKSMLTWGPVNPPSGNFQDIRNIYPASKEIHDHTHVLRLDGSFEYWRVRFEDNLRAELYEVNTRRTDALLVPANASSPNLLTQVEEGQRNWFVANSFGMEKQLTSWWQASGGYYYSWLEGDASFRLKPKDGNGAPAAGDAWSANNILLNQVSHVFNASSQFTPVKDLTAVAGAQGSWMRQESFGDVSLNEVVDPNDPTAGIFRIPATVRSDLDQTGAQELVSLRYSGLPFTALFGEVRLKQEEFSQFKDETSGPHSFLLDTDARSHWEEYRAGFTTSPWRRISVTGEYKHRDRKTGYDYLQDQFPFGNTNFIGPGYPGFILDRDTSTDEFLARLVIHPALWLKNTFTYQRIMTDYRTTTESTPLLFAGPDATPGGQVFDGNYNAHIFSANTLVTPFRRMTVSATVSYQKSDITTAANGSPSVAPYRGDIYSVLAGVSYGLTERTLTFINYSFSIADFAQENKAAGLPLGINYQRHGLQAGLVWNMSKHAIGRLQYSFFKYDEPSSEHHNDYTAHQVLGVVTVKLP